METIEIQFSKKKHLLALVGSALFIAGGVVFIMNPTEFAGRRTSKEIVFLVGIVTVIFFGICLFNIVKQLFSKYPGLIVNSKGLVVNSASNSAVISWEDIQGIRVDNVANQKFVSIHLKNPQKFISAQGSLFTRKLISQNYKMVGTPISISSNTLKISFNELHSLLQDRFDKYKQSQNQLTLQ